MYIVLVNRYEDDDLYAWKPVEFLDDETNPRGVMAQLSLQLSEGDLVATISSEHASDIIPNLENLSIVIDDGKLVELKPTPDGVYPKDKNRLYTFLREDIEMSMFYREFSYFKAKESVVFAIGLYDMIPDAFDGMVRASPRLEGWREMISILRRWTLGEETGAWTEQKLRELMTVKPEKEPALFKPEKRYQLHSNFYRSLYYITEMFLGDITADTMSYFIYEVTQVYVAFSQSQGMPQSVRDVQLAMTERMRPMFSFQAAAVARLLK